MRFVETPLRGAYLIEIEPVTDPRGFFARTWCAEEFAAHGLNAALSQCNISVSHQRATLRGMHYQSAPHEEAKLVRCTRGAIYDVIIDLRPQSATFRHWFSATLTAESHRMLYVPEGFAHGLLTLEDETEVFYQMSVPYAGASARGVRWNDPTFGIEWPEAPQTMSEKDRDWPDFS